MSTSVLHFGLSHCSGSMVYQVPSQRALLNGLLVQCCPFFSISSDMTGLQFLAFAVITDLESGIGGSQKTPVTLFDKQSSSVFHDHNPPPTPPFFHDTPSYQTSFSTVLNTVVLSAILPSCPTRNNCASKLQRTNLHSNLVLERSFQIL